MRLPAESRAGPGEEKMEYGSSSSVSGWQGFSSTPSHSSNEVIKWMNEAWKESCCWGPVGSQDATPHPATFCFSVFSWTRTEGEESSQGGDEAISAMPRIYQSRKACIQPTCDVSWLQPGSGAGREDCWQLAFVKSSRQSNTSLIVAVKPFLGATITTKGESLCFTFHTQKPPHCSPPT